MRARERYLGLLCDRPPTTDEDAAPLDRVVLTREAHRALLRQLDVPGRLRSGLLFGTLTSGVLSGRAYSDDFGDPLQLSCSLGEVPRLESGGGEQTESSP